MGAVAMGHSAYMGLARRAYARGRPSTSHIPCTVRGTSNDPRSVRGKTWGRPGVMTGIDIEIRCLSGRSTRRVSRCYMPNRERFLMHVTLTSGDLRRSPLSEVSPDTIAILGPLIEQALCGQHALIPGQPSYTMTGGASSRCAMITLWRIVPDTTGERIPVLHVGIAGHSRCGAALWRRMHELAGTRLPIVASPDHQPVTPWCADLLDIGIALDPQITGWTGDWSRCVAWTYLTMIAERE